MTKKLWLNAAFLPLVIAPAAIVASCSNDTTTPANQTETSKEINRLNTDIIPSQKLKIKDSEKTFDDTKLNDLKNNPNKLLSNYLDKTELALDENKFNYEIDGLSVVEPKQDASPDVQPRTLNFKFKVTNKANNGETGTTNLASVAFEYQPAAQPPTESAALEKAVKAIEKAYDDGTFKLKDGKTITQNDIDTLKANAATFLSEFTQGLPNLDSGLTTKIVQTSFDIIDKPGGARQDQQQMKQINFKVTVIEDQSKKEKETKLFTFEFALQNPVTPPNPQPPGGGGEGSTPFSTKNNSK